MVLDRADATAPSQRQTVTSSDGIVSPDPFRDVIKTEPAPDLPSLIEDMIPYLVERGISTPRPTTPMSNGIKSSLGGHSTLYNSYEDHIDRRKDDDVVVTGVPMPEADEGFDFHSENFEKLSQSKEGTKFTNDDRNRNVSYGNANPSATDDGEDLTAISHGATSTEIVSLESAGEKSDAEAESQEDDGDKEESIYSFGNVLDLLFSSETTTAKPVANETSVVSDFSTSIPSSPKTAIPYISTTSKPPLQIEDAPTVQGGNLLKLAGCNIYGRMYRVGRIITELSGPCLECRCTEVGVQCKKLSC